MSLNKDIINSISDAMIGFNPRLKRLIPDGDEDQNGFDSFKAEIIRILPLPIGKELQRLLTRENDGPHRARLDQIIKLVERSMQFVSFVLVLQLLDDCIEGKCEPSGAFFNEFGRRFKTLSMGDFAWLIEEIGKIITKNKLEPYMPEVKFLLTNTFYKELRFWTPERK